MCRKLYCQTFLIHSSTEHTNTLHLSTSESSITTRYFSTIVRKKINWDKGKELPSKFITHYINKCSASNMICLYHTPEGSLLSSVSEIEQTITTQFSSLYSPFQKSSFISFPPSMKRISAQALLQAPISHEEIKSVILQMKPLSALRPDTLPAALYQVCTHPILLCNVDYKIFSTILSNQVKKMIKQVTYPTQIGYQPRQRLHKHVLLIDYLIKTHQSNTFLWIDFAKAFNFISHEYLFELLEHVDFPNSMVNAPLNEAPGRVIQSRGICST
eukprot:TRINITY_DN4981_c1_g1_i1.p1 TRINITY_DN4981_c1_g1~~TRINITY_DN4981_c1_g1_i1.p1  ORF type:complete len:272 (+),score=5.03 TRINITY_DN4981_c1_g1_i1:615-1430(+)